MTDVPHETSLLETLHGGWPFGCGPGQWHWFIAWKPPTDIQPAGYHVCCRDCGQSITRLGNWAVSWESLKPQVAAHVMQVHPEAVTG